MYCERFVNNTISLDLLIVQFVCQHAICTASDLSTIQFRLIFKGHKSLEYCCFVIHLTSVNTISYDFYPLLRHQALQYHISHYTTLHYTTLHYTTLHYTTLHYTTLQCYSFHVPQLTIRDCCCINCILI
jgi:hypothetical protein